MSDAKNVIETVREIIAELLDFEFDEVRPEANFFHDLDGESIDLLDLAFRVERALGVRVDFRKHFETETPYIDEGGQWNQAALARLPEQYPQFDIGMIEATRGEANVMDLLTVRNIAAIVERAIADEQSEPAA